MHRDEVDVAGVGRGIGIQRDVGDHDLRVPAAGRRDVRRHAHVQVAIGRQLRRDVLGRDADVAAGAAVGEPEHQLPQHGPEGEVIGAAAGVHGPLRVAVDEAVVVRPPRERLPVGAVVEGLEEVHRGAGRRRHVDVGAGDRPGPVVRVVLPVDEHLAGRKARLVERQRRRVEGLHARPIDVGVVVRVRDVAVRERAPASSASMMKRVGCLMPGQASDQSGRRPWCST